MKYYLIAGEPSGDALGVRPIEALRRKDKDAQFFGIGGDSMKALGFSSLFDISELAVMGIMEVIPSIPRILKRMNQTIAEIKSLKPDVIITIDSWSFCARIHKKIRKLHLNIPQVHYVAPQVWAWKKKRARTMYKYIDLLLTLFPNEPQYFIPNHLPAVFVGHPVIESAVVNAAPKGTFRERHNIPADKRIMLILPGSRHNEVKNLLPDFLNAIHKLSAEYPDFVYVLPTVSTVAARVKKMLANSTVPALVVEGEQERRSAFQDADAAIAASGTVALELAIVKVPHIVAYKVPKLTELLVRNFLHFRFINLSNILLNRLIVPELLQNHCNPENIAFYMRQLIEKQPLYNSQIEGFEQVRKILGMGEQIPSDNAAAAILNFIRKQ